MIFCLYFFLSYFRMSLNFVFQGTFQLCVFGAPVWDERCSLAKKFLNAACSQHARSATLFIYQGRINIWIVEQQLHHVRVSIHCGPHQRAVGGPIVDDDTGKTRVVFFGWGSKLEEKKYTK